MTLKSTFAALLLLSATGVQAQSPLEFKNPPLSARPTPLWFWNNTAVTSEGVDAQIVDLRDKGGYGGVSILPFGKDFSPKYLSEAYFELYGHTVRRATELGLQMALYDEYGFPSGSGGAINGDDMPRFLNRYPNLTMKRLDKIEEEVTGGQPYHKEASTEGALMAVVAMNTATLERVDLTDKVTEGVIVWNVPAGRWKIMQFVCVTDGDPNMDYLSVEAAEAYIEMTHEQYYKRFPEAFGRTITQTFYDEPTLYRAQGRVWTPSFNEEFITRYGESPTLLYPALWYDIGEQTASARNALFTLRSDLYAEAYPRAIDRWSREHGTRATGHQDNEEVENPVGTSGDLMKCFRYLEIPGIDRIGEDAENPRPAQKFYKIISSAAYNWDHSLAMSETYGAMGNLSFDSMYSIAMDQFSKGINAFIPHAAWYNDQKVTFLPELSSRNPLYADGLYELSTFLGRLQLMLQNEDRAVAEVAVLYPIHTMQGDHRFGGPLTAYKGGVHIPYLDYTRVGMALSDTLGRDYLWLHPEVLAGACTVDKKGLTLNNKIQKNTFHTLVIPASRTISVTTLEQARKLFLAGGTVVFTSLLPTRSAEKDGDFRIKALMEELLPAGSRYNESLSGGKVYFLAKPTPAALTEALSSGRTPDIAFETGKPLRYIHKEHAGKALFYLANCPPTLYRGEVTLRGKLTLEAWNPHTGAITPVRGVYAKEGKETVTRINLELNGRESVFLVEK